MNWSSYPCACFLIGFLMLAAAPAVGAPEQTVWLSSLDLSAVSQGWGVPHANLSVEGHPLAIAGRKFEHGLGTHSPGSFIIDLGGGSRQFSAWVGIDDEVGRRGSAIFQILADGRPVWDSGVMHGGDAAKPVELDVSGVRQLLLLISDAGDGFEFDHSDWADARFIVIGARPRSVKTVMSDPVIATPAPSGKPRINSPSVFGVYTGTPVLINISAVGAPPLRFAARHLPRGLKLNHTTGQITGRLAGPRKYDFTAIARDAAGSDQKPIRIEIGDKIALTPPIGWNSYDSFGDDVTEAEVMANARTLAQKLHPYGWEYVVIDYRWYDPGASSAPNNPNARRGAVLSMDSYGRLTPPANRFPSATDGRGFKALADEIHAMGLRFGIHIMRGIPRQAVKANTPIEGSIYHAADAANTNSVCGWCPDMYGVDTSKPAGQAWYDSILRQYAQWGVDLIKVDDMSSPYSAGEIAAVRTAISRCGRSIVFSLSPGETPIDQAAHVVAHANMWRISGDFWDDWGALNHQFDLIARWQGDGGPGHWPDADMIPLGHLSIHNRSVGNDRQTHFTHSEQMTLISLWAMDPSPLMLGMNLPDDDPWTTALLTNDEILAVNQDPLGKQAERVKQEDGAEIWVKAMQDGSRVIGLFNRAGAPLPVTATWSDLGIPQHERVRDLWQRKDLGTFDKVFQTPVPAHGAVMLRVYAR